MVKPLNLPNVGEIVKVKLSKKETRYGKVKYLLGLTHVVVEIPTLGQNVTVSLEDVSLLPDRPQKYSGTRVKPAIYPLQEGSDRKDNVVKDTNPKDAVGTKKPPFSTVSGPVFAEVGVGMLEGARKYGRHNYRVSGVRASVYYDAALRHLTSWFEGEDVDPDSGLSHVTKAICSLVVLRDAVIHDQLVDDRPPVTVLPAEHRK